MVQVHNAFVEGETIDAAGRPIHWSNEHGGFLAEGPDWLGGRVIHLQSRSLEHYVKRDYQLEELRRNSGDPIHEVTRNGEYSTEITRLPLFVADSYLNVMATQSEAQARIIETILFGLPEGLDTSLSHLLQRRPSALFVSSKTPHEHEVSQGWISSHASTPNCIWSAFEQSEPYSIVKIVDHFGRVLGSQIHRVAAQSAPTNLMQEGQEGTELFGLLLSGSPRIYLFAGDFRRIAISADPRISPILAYETWSNPNGTFSLGHPRTERLLGVTPDGEVMANKKRAREWEQFSIHPVGGEVVRKLLNVDIPELANYLRSATTISAIRRLSTGRRVPASIVPAAFCALEPCERRALEILLQGVLGEHLY